MKTNIGKVRKEKGIKQKELADILGVVPSAISLYETGKRDPSMPVLRKMASYFNVSVGYLLGIEDKPYMSDETIQELPPPAELNPLQIPLLGYVGASEVQDLIEGDYGETVGAPLGYDDIDGLFALTAAGDSMEPEIMNRAVVIVDRFKEPAKFDIVVFAVNGDGGALKYYVPDKDGVHFVPANEEYGVISYSRRQCAEIPVHILGVVVEIRNPPIRSRKGDTRAIEERVLKSKTPPGVNGDALCTNGCKS